LLLQRLQCALAFVLYLVCMYTYMHVCMYGDGEVVTKEVGEGRARRSGQEERQRHICQCCG